MKYLKKFININEEFNSDVINKSKNPYNDIMENIESILGDTNYLDEPNIPYKELYNKLLSIKHRSEELLEEIKSMGDKSLQWVEMVDVPFGDIKDNLEDISKYCYQFTRSKRSLEKLKNIS